MDSEGPLTLSKEQLQFYHDNGYLVINQLINFASLYTYKKRFVQISSGLVPRGLMTIVKERQLMEGSKKPEDYINKVQDFLFDDVLSSYAEDARLLDVVSQFVGGDITAMHSMLINKPPGTGEHPPHQDLYYFPFRPADKIVAAWTAIDDVTYENGCLYVVPGTHKQAKLYEHDYTSATSKMYHGILDATVAPESRRIHLEMSPGDTVFFHPYLIHGSRPNVSKNYRKAITCHFANTGVQFLDDVTGTVQERIAREAESESRRRGFELSFKDIWKYRSKEVRASKVLSKY